MPKTTQRQSSISHRMKSGELYVVYSGLQDGHMGLLGYGDGTPRIYKKGSVDDRIGKSLPVCRNMATGETMLKRGNHAVFVPLSEMVFCWGEREARAWGKVQEHVSHEDVRDYVKRWSDARKAA